MSWTVHEDEYRAAEPNVEQILQQVVEEDEGKNITASQAKPPRRYTESSQVFATPSPIIPADLNTSVKGSLDGMNPWLSAQTPSNTSLCGDVPQYVHPQQSSHGNYLNYRLGVATPYEKPTKAVGMEAFSFNSPVNKRGGFSSSMPVPDARKMPVAMPMTDGASPEIVAPTPYTEWLNSLGNKFSQSGPQLAAFNNITTEGLRGKVYEIAKDQYGCRFLQRWLDTNCDPKLIQVIMDEIIPHVAELMTDQYANFLVQKLFDIMRDDVRYNVACVAAPQISMIALTPHGTFSVQKMIETISTKEEMAIVREALSRDVVRLVKDANGNHVIQKVLQRFDYADKEFIYEAVAVDCVAVAKNKQGCCVLQRCLEHASPVQKTVLVKRILSCCLQIAQDPFGNYVLQYILDAKDSSINDTIAMAFLPHLVTLCMNKFSSNVMEKVLRGASAKVQELYVKAMCNPDVVDRLIQDDFGNYVLQTALSISSPGMSEKLVATIRPLMPRIKNAPYAKKLEGKLDAITRKYLGAYRGGVDYQAMNGHADSGASMYGRVGGYGYHRYHAEPRPTSWRPS